VRVVTIKNKGRKKERKSIDGAKKHKSLTVKMSIYLEFPRVPWVPWESHGMGIAKLIS